MCSGKAGHAFTSLIIRADAAPEIKGRLYRRTQESDVDVISPLSDPECEELEALIAMRVPPFKGVMRGSITAIHGFLTAIVSGPMAPPSEWVPLLIGDTTGWAMEQTEWAVMLVMRLFNEIASDLNGDGFSVLVDHRADLSEPGTTLGLAHDWCIGYVFGMLPCEREWQTAVKAPELQQPFFPMLLLAQPGSSKSLASLGDLDASRTMLDELSGYARTIFKWWKPRIAAALRVASASPRGGTVRRAGPKIGPNAPCPCGSGKKHKRCCSARAA